MLDLLITANSSQQLHIRERESLFQLVLRQDMFGHTMVDCVHNFLQKIIQFVLYYNLVLSCVIGHFVCNCDGSITGLCFCTLLFLLCFHVPVVRLIMFTCDSLQCVSLFNLFFSCVVVCSPSSLDVALHCIGCPHLYEL